MKTLWNKLRFALFATLVVLFLAPLTYAQQNLLVSTTLSVAVSAPASPGAPPVPYGQVQIASATGITASLNQSGTINQQNLWVLYIDREEMAVVGLSGTNLQVIRGYNSTVASAHVSGTMVLYGRAAWFYNYDPGAQSSNGQTTVSGAGCTTASVLVSPWVNVRSGMQWLCSSDTLSWVPGFNNGYGGLANVPSAGTEASAAGTNAVLGPVFAISGTNAIVTFTVPVGFNGTAAGGGCFTVIPKGIFTWTAAGNIAVLGTTTAITQNVSFCWNPYTSKWIPSRVS